MLRRDRFENRSWYIVARNHVLVRRMAEKLRSQPAELTGRTITDCNNLYKFGQKSFFTSIFKFSRSISAFLFSIMLLIIKDSACNEVVLIFRMSLKFLMKASPFFRSNFKNESTDCAKGKLSNLFLQLPIILYIT